MSEIISAFKEFIINLDIFKTFFVDGRIILDYVHAGVNYIFEGLLVFGFVLTIIYLYFAIYAIFNKKKYEETPLDMDKAPSITVQIPTRNEIIALRCAKRCLESDYPKDKFEILLGDDSDKPEISRQLAEFASKYDNVKVIKREKNIGYKPGNLNNMLDHSSGEFIVVFDSDFEPGKDFLKRIVAPMVDNKDISAVQSRWNFNNFNQNFVTVLASTIVNICHRVFLEFMRDNNTAFLCGSAEAVRKSDLIELGGWKSGSLTEDIEYSLRLYKANKIIRYLPNLECYSEVPYKAKDLYRQQMRWGYGVITSYKEHLSGLLRQPKELRHKLLSLTPGFGYLLPMLILFLTVLGAVSIVTHRPEPLDLARFFSGLFKNIAWTSGLLIMSFVALFKANKAKYVFQTILSSFSFGLVTTYYVNMGIYKAITGKPMPWYLLSKETQKKE